MRRLAFGTLIIHMKLINAKFIKRSMNLKIDMFTRLFI